MSLKAIQPLRYGGVKSTWLASLPDSGTEMLTISSTGVVSRQAIPVASFGALTGVPSDNAALQSALDAKANNSSLANYLPLAGGTLTGALLSSLGTITANTPGISLTQTWNNSGATFDLLSATVTRTTANTNSRWINFNNANNWGGNAIPYFQVGVATGAIAITGMWGTASLALGNTSSGGSIETVYQDGFLFKQYTTNVLYINTGSYQDRGLECQQSGMAIGWTDLKMRRDGANTLALYRTTNAQRFNLYGTRTDGSNYRRFYISSTTNGEFTIGADGLGTGSAGNTLVFASGNNLIEQRNSTNGQTSRIFNTYTSTTNFENFQQTWVSNEFRMGSHVPGSGGTGSNRNAALGIWDTNGFWKPLLTVAANSGAPSLSITPQHPTGLTYTAATIVSSLTTAGTEATEVNFNLSSTKNWNTGAITTQRAFRIQAPTYAFAGASTITNASTLAISGAPIAGTNATITNAFALNIENGALGVGIAGSDYGRIIIQDSGQLSSNNAIRVHAGGIYLGQNISVFTVLHNGSVYVRGTLTTDSLGGGIVTHNMSFDGGWGNLTRAITTPQGYGNRFTNVYGLQIACGNNYGLMVTGSGSNIQLYNTFTDTSNYIRQALSFTTYSSTIHAQWAAEGLGTGAVNIPMVLTPRGTGAFILGPMPDGTITGGNARGANAVDLQLSRSAATQVASGSGAFTAGVGCMASGSTCVAVGLFSAAIAGNSCFVFGDYATASGEYSFAFGRGTSSAWHSFGFGRGFLSNRSGQFSFANGSFSTGGDAQNTKFVARCTTTGTTPGNLLLGTSWGASATDRISINSGEVFGFLINIIGSKSDGSALTHYVRKGAIKRVSNTTTLAYVETVGTDYEDNAATDVSITADDTNDALQISVTGIAGETWRWVATIEAADLGFGT